MTQLKFELSLKNKNNFTETETQTIETIDKQH